MPFFLLEFDLRFVQYLRIRYESHMVESMTRQSSSILAFKGQKTPTVEVEDGTIPDLHSCCFTADFSYALAVAKKIAVFADVKTTNIDDALT